MNPSFMWNPPAPANRSGAGSFQDHSTPAMGPPLPRISALSGNDFTSNLASNPNSTNTNTNVDALNSYSARIAELVQIVQQGQLALAQAGLLPPASHPSSSSHTSQPVVSVPSGSMTSIGSASSPHIPITGFVWNPFSANLVNSNSMYSSASSVPSGMGLNSPHHLVPVFPGLSQSAVSSMESGEKSDLRTGSESSSPGMHRKNLSTSSSSHHSSPSLGRDISTSLNEYSAVDMLASVATSASSPRFYVPEHNDARNVLHNSNVRSSVQRSQVPTASLHSLDSLIPHSSMSAHRLKNGSYLSPSAVQSVSSAVFLPSIQTLHSDNPHQLVLGIPHRSEDHLTDETLRNSSLSYSPRFLPSHVKLATSQFSSEEPSKKKLDIRRRSNSRTSENSRIRFEETHGKVDQGSAGQSNILIADHTGTTSAIRGDVSVVSTLPGSEDTDVVWPGFLTIEKSFGVERLLGAGVCPQFSVESIVSRWLLSIKPARAPSEAFRSALPRELVTKPYAYDLRLRFEPKSLESMSQSRSSPEDERMYDELQEFFRIVAHSGGHLHGEVCLVEYDSLIRVEHSRRLDKPPMTGTLSFRVVRLGSGVFTGTARFRFETTSHVFGGGQYFRLLYLVYSASSNSGGRPLLGFTSEWFALYAKKKKYRIDRRDRKRSCHAIEEDVGFEDETYSADFLPPSPTSSVETPRILMPKPNYDGPLAWAELMTTQASMREFAAALLPEQRIALIDILNESTLTEAPQALPGAGDELDQGSQESLATSSEEADDSLLPLSPVVADADDSAESEMKDPSEFVNTSNSCFPADFGNSCCSLPPFSSLEVGPSSSLPQTDGLLPESIALVDVNVRTSPSDFDVSSTKELVQHVNSDCV